jgi:hypothetical protein
MAESELPPSLRARTSSWRQAEELEGEYKNYPSVVRAVTPIPPNIVAEIARRLVAARHDARSVFERLADSEVGDAVTALLEEGSRLREDGTIEHLASNRAGALVDVETFSQLRGAALEVEEVAFRRCRLLTTSVGDEIALEFS